MRAETLATGRRERRGARRRGREFCLGLLYAMDAAGGDPQRVLETAEETLSALLEMWGLSAAEAEKLRAAVSEFGHRLLEAYLEHRAEIDARINALSQGWTVDRMPVVDRNLLRMAMAELLYLADVPMGATIDEAVDLAKTYGTAESGKFVNGVLGTLARELQQAGQAAGGAE